MRRPTLAALLAVVVLGAALRLYRLDEVPAFVDEDMYTTVAVEMTHLAWPAYVLHSTDSASTGIAKTPLVFMAQAELTARGLDPLIAGRAISALSGVISIPLVFWLGHRLGGGAPVGLLAAGMYALLPLAVVHERMVLQDGPMSTAALAAVLVADLASSRGSIRWFVLAGVLGALAVQLKVSAVFVAVVLTRIALVGWAHKPWRLRAGALLMPAGPASAYLALMLAPTGPGLAAQNAIVAGATPPSIAANLTVLADTLGTYLPWGLWLLAPVGYLVLTRRNSRFGVAVLWALVAFIVPWLVLSRGSPSRYYLAAMPYVCGLVALALASLADVLPASHGRWGRTLVFLPPAAALAVLLAFSARLVLDFDHAVLSVQDDWAYRSGWPSGYMYAEASRFIATTAGPETAVAYVVDDQHRIAMGLYRRQADGFALAGPLLLDPRIAPALRGADYVVVDDTRYEQPGERLASLRALAPELSELAHFTNPDSRAGVSVLAVARRATGQSRSRRRPGPGTRGR